MKRHIPPKAARVALMFPSPNLKGSFAFLVLLCVTGLTIHGNKPSEIGRYGTIGSGLGIVFSALYDWRAGGFRNLIRTDLMAILSLYFLTLFEFLLSKEYYNTQATASLTQGAVIACLWGFAGIVIGRHLVNLRRQPFSWMLTAPVPGSWLLTIFWICISLSFFHMLLAVNFNPIAMVKWFIEPRFSQPWQRNQLGGWKDLLNEFAMLLNLIPPLAGIMIARRKKFTFLQIGFVWAGFLLTIFYGFTCGTRNVFVSFLVTFLIGFAFAMPTGRVKELFITSGVCVVFLLVANTVMLNFRTIGMVNYMQGNYKVVDDGTDDEFTVDNDLEAISKIVECFPRYHQYLGWEVPYLALIRPIPRALWQKKPVGISFTIEDVYNVDNLTIAASFVGESYMMGGMAAVFVAGLVFGALAGWWNYFASPHNSELGILIYASGFVTTVITMRSLYVFTTTILPTIAAIIIGVIVMNSRKKKTLLRPRNAPAVPLRTQRP